MNHKCSKKQRCLNFRTLIDKSCSLIDKENLASSALKEKSELSTDWSKISLDTNSGRPNSINMQNRRTRSNAIQKFYSLTEFDKNEIQVGLHLSQNPTLRRMVSHLRTSIQLSRSLIEPNLIKKLEKWIINWSIFLMKFY